MVRMPWVTGLLSLGYELINTNIELCKIFQHDKLSYLTLLFFFCFLLARGSHNGDDTSVEWTH